MYILASSLKNNNKNKNSKPPPNGIGSGSGVCVWDDTACLLCHLSFASFLHRKSRPWQTLLSRASIFHWGLPLGRAHNSTASGQGQRLAKAKRSEQLKEADGWQVSAIAKLPDSKFGPVCAFINPRMLCSVVRVPCANHEGAGRMSHFFANTKG